MICDHFYKISLVKESTSYKLGDFFFNKSQTLNVEKIEQNLLEFQKNVINFFIYE